MKTKYFLIFFLFLINQCYSQINYGYQTVLSKPNYTVNIISALELKSDTSIACFTEFDLNNTSNSFFSKITPQGEIQNKVPLTYNNTPTLFQNYVKTNSCIYFIETLFINNEFLILLSEYTNEMEIVQIHSYNLNENNCSFFAITDAKSEGNEIFFTGFYQKNDDCNTFLMTFDTISKTFFFREFDLPYSQLSTSLIKRNNYSFILAVYGYISMEFSSFILEYEKTFNTFNTYGISEMFGVNTIISNNESSYFLSGLAIEVSKDYTYQFKISERSKYNHEILNEITFGRTDTFDYTSTIPNIILTTEGGLYHVGTSNFNGYKETTNNSFVVVSKFDTDFEFFMGKNIYFRHCRLSWVDNF